MPLIVLTGHSLVKMSSGSIRWSRENGGNSHETKPQT
jgi:hypothetical protein